MTILSWLRNSMLAKWLGVLAGVAFIFSLIRVRGSLSFIASVTGAVVLVALARAYLSKRRKRLTPPEEEYLKDRFYEQ